MSQILNALYYKGTKPVPVSAEVALEEQGFRIRIQNVQADEDVFWNIKDIYSDYQEDSSSFILRYGKKHPYEYLEFQSADAYDRIRIRYPFRKWTVEEGFFGRYPLAVAAIAFGAFLALILGLYLMLVPRLADGLANRVSIEWETELGSKLSAGAVPTAQVDTSKSQLLDSFFLAIKIETPYPIRIHYVRDTILNAFAMPGGTIVIYEGLFDRLESPEALAGLIGHEYTHVAFRHSLKSMFRSLSSYFLLSAVLGDISGLAGILAENANSIRNLSYSRKFEREADAHSADLLIERKINLKGMLDLFQVFREEAKKGGRVPEFLSTHPVTDDRIVYIQERINKDQKRTEKQARLEDLFQRLKSLE